MKFTPFSDRVLVMPLGSVTEVSGILMPDSAKKEFLMGLIVSVGRGAMNERNEIVPMESKEGMKVLFGPYAGIPIHIAGQEYLVLREGELAGELQEDSACKPETPRA